ncbi:MAG: addiction module protein [Candidatus Marinimicrobia bacterium]|nr:addiction module protein [Candidatus Neomarinimicrobiota bacterium]MBL7010020.1 addiction module protein [Candidatus Neomarinimicrobiota bacterium]MBL7029730.1 addiction module protein [Candidatus Neomarinimicrobiota bacterium]
MLKENIQQEVLELKSIEKIQLVELLLESLDKPDMEIQNEWIEESEKRYDAYKSGKVKAFSYEEVMNMLDK